MSLSQPPSQGVSPVGGFAELSCKSMQYLAVSGRHKSNLAFNKSHSAEMSVYRTSMSSKEFDRSDSVI